MPKGTPPRKSNGRFKSAAKSTSSKRQKRSTDGRFKSPFTHTGKGARRPPKGPPPDAS